MLRRSDVVVVLACTVALLACHPEMIRASAATEEDAELRDLLARAPTFVPDRGEPAGAIKAYLHTEQDVRRAARRLEVGLVPNEPDRDLDSLLDPALIVRREATLKFPTSRHAWQGLAEVLWLKYKVSHKAADLREAIDANEHAADLLIRLYSSAGGDAGRDFSSYTLQIADGRAALPDVVGLDGFFQKLKGTEWWDIAVVHYARGLGRLGDPRAEPLWREILAAAPPGVTDTSYMEYLWDRGRYQDALDVYDRREYRSLGPSEHAVRGALLEQLGRYGDAEAEYQHFFGAVRSGPWGSAMWLQDRYRIAGSKLQQGIKFRPDPSQLANP